MKFPGLKNAGLICVSALIVFIFSCKKKDASDTITYTPDCSGATPAYAANVNPIISANCATSGCHAAGNTNGPGALTTYTQVKSAAASIRSSVVSGSMPKNSTLTTEQKNTIVCWIDAGAQNN